MNNRTEREILCGEISDAYKDAYGIRPRHIDWNAPMDTLLGIRDGLYAEVERQIREETEIALEEERHITKLCEEQGITRSTYERWMEQAEEVR